MSQPLYFQDMKNKIADSHCHLDFKDFEEDFQEVLNNARKNKVEYFLSISVDLKKFQKILMITKKNRNVWCSTGVHPNNVPKKIDSNNIDKLKKKLILNLKNKKVVGLGETGLDFYRDDTNQLNQIDYFKTHMEISGKTNIPLIVHTRNADNMMASCLNRFVKIHNCKGVLHSFSSDIQLAKCALDNGFYLSFSGMVTFKNAIELREVVDYVPLNRILVETDSPYLAPVPKRGKRNEPAFTKFTLEQVAEIKKISFDKAANITTENFFKLFTRAKCEI